ncbi:hypothetical protein WMY93_013151 [Mugilogobius chulae]|uniref:Collectrin-like domain-containing protein n=1 Tax=Mugilogobius chulae TaxID=88201 RepID=A0AAW0P2V5_9GOBI
MGDNAYTWNANEQFLFKANIAYALRQYYQLKKNTTITITSNDVEVYDETPRISFYILVKNPAQMNQFFPKEDVEEAIRMSRGRINDAFQLTDNTLEFVGVPPTLAPPFEQPVEVWLVAFGVVMGVVVLTGFYLVFSGIRERKKKPKEEVVENPYETNFDGHSNKAFDSENEQTGF